MSDYVKIGRKFINLDLVTHVTPDIEAGEPALNVWFDNGTQTLVVGRENVDVLLGCLDERVG